MPEQTENYIHIPIKDKSNFVESSFRTISISESKGIKAVIGKLTSDPNGSTHVQKYMFDVNKWDMPEAKKWVNDHKAETDDYLRNEYDADSWGIQHFVAEKWNTAFINNLPDAAFAYVESGQKDDEGKTVPRGNRHLPHHTMSVKSGSENSTVDKAHLRNALARVDQTNISPEAKAKAKAHLQKHAKALGIGE
jgi:hypothetical protein